MTQNTMLASTKVSLFLIVSARPSSIHSFSSSEASVFIVFFI